MGSFGFSSGGGGLFGSSLGSSGASLFGQAGSGFGGSGGGMFGGAVGGGGFGGPASQPQQTASSFFGGQSSSLFGAPSGGGQSTAGLFGGGQGYVGSAPFSSSSLFASQQSAPSLFGAPQSAPSLFGGQQSSSSLFGAQTTPSLFGAQSTPSLFGAQTTSSLFGAPQSGSTLFGSHSGGALGTLGSGIGGIGSSLYQQQPGSLFGAPQQNQQQQSTGLPAGLQAIVEALNSQSPYCRFRHIFYNVVDPASVGMYQRPAGIDERMWQQALQNNPDPSRLVPVQASSFDDLAARVEQQELRISQHLGALSSIDSALSKLHDDHDLKTGVKLAEYRRRYRELVRKLMSICLRLDRILARGRHLTPEELALQRRIDAITGMVSAPGQLKESLVDLSEDVDARLNEKKNSTMGSYVELLDARSAASLKALLSEQLQGISHLVNEANICERDISIISDGLKGL